MVRRKPPTRRQAASLLQRAFRKKRVSKEKRYGIIKSAGYNGFHCFKEKRYGSLRINTEDDGTGTVGGYSGTVDIWKLSDLTDCPNYRQLFDEYRLTGVKLKIFPVQDSAPSASTLNVAGGGAAGTISAEPIPNFWWNYDHNDAGNAADFQSVIAKDPKMVRFNRPLNLWVKNPCALSPVTENPDGAFNILNFVRAKRRSPWLPTASTDAAGDVGHVGLEMGLANAAINSQYSFAVLYTYYFQCKTSV